MSDSNSFPDNFISIPPMLIDLKTKTLGNNTIELNSAEQTFILRGKYNIIYPSYDQIQDIFDMHESLLALYNKKMEIFFRTYQNGIYR